jgi:hypothetical protein
MQEFDDSLYREGMSNYENQRALERARIGERWQSALGTGIQGLIGAGMLGSTVAANIEQGAVDNAGREMGESTARYDMMQKEDQRALALAKMDWDRGEKGLKMQHDLAQQGLGLSYAQLRQQESQFGRGLTSAEKIAQMQSRTSTSNALLATAPRISYQGTQGPAFQSSNPGGQTSGFYESVSGPAYAPGFVNTNYTGVAGTGIGSSALAKLGLPQYTGLGSTSRAKLRLASGSPVSHPLSRI